MKFLIKLLLISICLKAYCASGTKLVLSKDGKSDYVIVAAKNCPSKVKFAVRELRKFLKKSTGVDFKQVESSKASKYSKKIIVGNCSAAIKLLGDKAIKNLKNQEAIITTKGNNLLLTGGSNDMISYAVYSFLDKELGYRWYTAYGDVKIPKHRSLRIPQLSRRESPVFKYRYISTYGYQTRPYADLFFYRNGQNKGIRNYPEYPGMKDITPYIGRSCHTMFYFMNPGDKYHPAFKRFPKPSRKNLFKTNPDFYSMNKKGERVKTLQLCFGNSKMRKVLTSQLEDVIKVSGGKGIITLDANDVPGKFCYCEKCIALEKKYKTVAGPLLDYLIEFCGFLKKNYPQVMIKTLAYRKKQSERPPKNIKRLPDNLIITVAPIDDDFSKDFKHPNNLDTYNNLKKWCEITKNVWVWYYSNPFGAEKPPFGNIERMVADMKHMRDAGVTGSQFEHGGGVPECRNFAELQTWLFFKLFQNPDQDIEALIVEFTDFYYGKAASMMREYMKELEGERKAMKTFLKWSPSLSMFPYFTPENIVRWEKMFDKMEKLTAKKKKHLFHVKLARTSLDIVALCKYQKIITEYPDFKPNPDGLVLRIKNTYKKLGRKRLYKATSYYTKKLNKLLDSRLLLAKSKVKALPEKFRNIPDSELKQAFPTKKIKKAQGAAIGFAQIEACKKCNKTPYKVGFYDSYNKKFVCYRPIKKDEIIPDKYHLYKIGRARLTPGCLVWGGCWRYINIRVEQFYLTGYPNIEWDIYISLKFEGKLYSSKSKFNKNQVLCDRVILVKCTK